MAADSVGLGVLLAVAFLPPLIYLIRIRNVERFSRNPVSVMLLVFGWGAIGAIFLAFVLEDAFHLPLDSLRPSRVPSQLWIAVILAPLVEEPVKALGVLLLSKRRLKEEEDGLIYGAASGLGFAATENLAYEIAALIQFGFVGWVGTAIARTITSTLLHASASAMAGWGIAKAKRGEGAGPLVRYLLLAMVMHGTFNFFASLALLSTAEVSATLLSFLLVFAFAVIVYRYTRSKIRELDRRSAQPRLG